MLSARRTLRLSHTADIKRVPVGNDPAGRETMVAGLACSAVYPASTEQAERAGMASVARLMVVYTAVATVQPEWRFVSGGEDYRIRVVSRWPNGSAQFLELLVEQED